MLYFPNILSILYSVADSLTAFCCFEISEIISLEDIEMKDISKKVNVVFFHPPTEIKPEGIKFFL